ncbi:viroplasmin family protein [Brochothrix thermosphacta]|uniref:ribonuclease H1 domain-containing protein n=1 Tax=Brochothrix thermosphacta TaxID=2756 RepID=UPI00048CB704|nr:ribonuclease H family protein [Brochothrix thermosphacta]ODJ48183.1 hypothetical protein BFR34_11795 [Brochothrix thermosphacta DSM 20171 = FSL F6-1036]
MAKQKFYAIKKGHRVGIVNTWAECQALTKGYSGAIYKSFPTKKEAEDFVQGINSAQPAHIVAYNPGELVAYVDGSYNKNTEEFSYGMVIIDNDKVIHQEGRKFKNEFSPMRNVAGEVYGAKRAIEYASELGKDVGIYYDYTGIEHWAKGEWKTNNTLTKGYREYVSSINNIKITFHKVAAHTGVEYNEMVDQIAKQALFG